MRLGSFYFVRRGWNGQVLVNFFAERISLTCGQSSGCRRSRVINSASSAVSGLSSSCTLSMPMTPFAVHSTLQKLRMWHIGRTSRETLESPSGSDPWRAFLFYLASLFSSMTRHLHCFENGGRVTPTFASDGENTFPSILLQYGHEQAFIL